jgi:methyl-accepting chemotaxis protein
MEATSRAAGGAILLLGSLVLVGWLFDIGLLKGVLPGLVTMKANTALCFALSGTSLGLLRAAQAGRRADYVAYGCASLVVAVGLLTMGQYLFGWNLGIDELLFKDLSAAIKTSAPGRMAPSTAVCFILMGSALILLRRDLRTGFLPAQIFSIVTASIGVLAIIGYAYGVEVFYGVASYTRMAIHTAAGFVVLAAGAIFAFPERGILSIVTGQYAGSILARRQLPAVLVVPAFLGWLFIVGERSGSYNSAFSVSLFTVSTIIIFVVLTLMTSSVLNRVDHDRIAAEEPFRQRLRERIDAEQAARKEAERLSSDLNKMVASIEASLEAEKQAQAETARLQQEIIRVQEATLEELSTPLIPINDQITVMPLVGAVDSRRSQRVMEVLLFGVSKSRAKLVILDVTGVAVVDTQVAEGLVRAARALRLLGARVVITGIRPEVAQTLVTLGVQLGDIVTHGTLQSGIEYGMAALGKPLSGSSGPRSRPF